MASHENRSQSLISLRQVVQIDRMEVGEDLKGGSIVG
jgi:hypothetical protein